MKTNNTNYNITLITLKGCEGCNIMLSNIREAISKTNKSINFNKTELEHNTIKDNKDILEKYQIKDFPATLLLKENNLLHKYIGTVPTQIILNWFNIYFN